MMMIKMPLPFANVRRVLLIASLVSAYSGSAFLPRAVCCRHSSLSSSSSRLFSSSSSSSSSTTMTTTTDSDTPAVLPSFSSRESYLEFLERASALPGGFATGTAGGTFVSVEAPAMGNLPISATVLYLTDGPTDNWAAVFTQNKFPGAPVLVGRDRLDNGGPLQAVVINNKVSNVCAGGDGVADAEHVCDAVASSLNLPDSNLVLPSSTGVIGWRLPATELATEVVPAAVAAMQTSSALPAATAIMTTDRYPKLRSITLPSNGVRIVGIAKGAGMIEPNMATMLAYVLTDATIAKSDLQDMLTKAVNQSFNSISVDGDESTSDTCVAICSNRISQDTNLEEFQEALNQVCTGLAADLVRNGEGTAHVMRVRITKFPGTDLDARRLGRHICNSPLFKCAVSGNDPNTGRLAGAIGSYMGKFHNDKSVASMSLTLGGRTIFQNGQFVLEGGDAVERELSGHMKDAQLGEVDEWPKHQKFVEIGVDFGSASSSGSGTATVLGSDLTAEYVSVNADYRS